MNLLRKLSIVVLMGSVVACSSESASPPSTSLPTTSAPTTSTTTSTTSSTSTTTTLPPVDVLLKVVESDQTNTSTFRVSAYDQPQIAQSFTLTAAIELEEVHFGISYVMTVAPEDLDKFFASSIAEKARYYTTQFDYGPIEFLVNIDIYRATAGDHLADEIDLSQGFELVDSAVTSQIVEKTLGINWKGSFNAVVPLGRSINLEPGVHFIVLSFDWATPELFQFWMLGRESGTNMRLRPDQSGPMATTCSYAPSDDLYLDGRAYYGLGQGGWSGTSVKRQWGTKFRFATAKVSACTDQVTGAAGGVWNQGDLAPNLVGRFRT